MDAAKAKPTVYIVDDDPAMLRALTVVVGTLDVDVEAYPSAEEFLKSYKPVGPGCLVLDVRLSGMSGPALREELIKTKATLPIIFISGVSEEEATREVRKGGAVAFLEKPFRPAALCDAIQRAIQADVEHWRRKQT